MRIIVHVNKCYDWVPVPSDVTVTQADIAAERVKPASGGGWLMKITKNVQTDTVIGLPEEQIIAKIIHDKTRPEGGRTLTRQQAVAFYLSENVMPHHAHRSWISGFEIIDDGPDEKLARAMIGRHVISETDRVAICTMDGTHAYVTVPTVAASSLGDAIPPLARCMSCGHCKGNITSDEPNIPPEDLEAHISAYTLPATADDHVSHLMTHFKVKKPASTTSSLKAVK